tara:strand:+ start:135 stop:770 length:636 start_codon:yes stop_codon:yes gene_type:complete
VAKHNPATRAERSLLLAYEARLLFRAPGHCWGHVPANFSDDVDDVDNLSATNVELPSLKLGNLGFNLAPPPGTHVHAGRGPANGRNQLRGITLAPKKGGKQIFPVRQVGSVKLPKNPSQSVQSRLYIVVGLGDPRAAANVPHGHTARGVPAMGEIANVFAPFLAEHPERQYLTELILAIESKTGLEQRFQAISDALVRGTPAGVKDVVGYM